MSDHGGMGALRPESRALLVRARRGAEDDPRALRDLRDDLADLTEDEIAALWAALDAAEPDDAPDNEAQDDDPTTLAYRAVDSARRKLLVPADRFRGMLIDHLAEKGGAPAPDATGGSLKALVTAFVDAGRGSEVEAAAAEIVKARSFAHDIT